MSLQSPAGSVQCMLVVCMVSSASSVHGKQFVLYCFFVLIRSRSMFELGLLTDQKP